MDGARTAAGIMQAFCERTGVTGGGAPQRYLWTDAFAVCNCLGLYRQTGSSDWLTLAGQLIDQVHAVLGRHRPDDPRTGWLSGLSDEEGARHPTAGGLRIGKPFPERRPDEPEDDSTDWERDGQYYHYLIRWVHALERTAALTGDVQRLHQAIELAASAHGAFTHDTASGPQLHWKMSIDLSRPAVAAVGQHDALDGFVVTASVRACAAAMQMSAPLQTEMRDLVRMCASHAWPTRDALGIGSLLSNALLLAQLVETDASIPTELLPRVLHDAARSLRLAALGRYMDGPPERRIAFRELGLAIGLAAVERLARIRAEGTPAAGQIGGALDELLEYLPLGVRIESFWLHAEHQQVSSWMDHEDINSVMLATCLLPDGFFR